MPGELIGLISTVSVLILTAAAWLVKRALQNAQQPTQVAAGGAAHADGYAPVPPQRPPLQSSPAERSGSWHAAYQPHNPPPPLPNMAHALGPLERAQNQAASEMFAPLSQAIGEMGRQIGERIGGVESSLKMHRVELNGRVDGIVETLDSVKDRLARLETKVDERTKRLGPPRATRSVE
jgi:hypothetical protein